MVDVKPSKVARTAALVFCLSPILLASQPAAQPDGDAVIARIDAIARSRYEHVLGFTDIEVYAVYRGKDETHPAATMTVKTTYKKGEGKSYEILSQSGSELIMKFGLRPLLDNEKAINVPGNVEKSWFTSANYEMKFKPGVAQRIDGRDCIAIAMTPRRKAPNMIDGTLWIDTTDDSIVRVEGIASKSPSVFAGTTHMMRQYSNIDSYAMSKHARAESNSALFGRTVVTIDYSDYHLQIAPER
jgi:hypothetical protein